MGKSLNEGGQSEVPENELKIDTSFYGGRF